MKRLFPIVALLLICGVSWTVRPEAQNTAPVNTELPAPLAAGDSMTNPTAPWVLSALMCWNSSGPSWQRCPASTGGAGAIDANTTRTAAASDSPEVVTLGGTGDTAATAGGTGSLSAKLRLLTSAVGTNNFNVGNITGTVSLPTGAATSSNQSTQNTTLSNIQTSVDAKVSGATNYTFLSTAAVLAASIKSTPGVVWDIQCFNETTSAVYVRLYDQSGSPATTDTANIKWRGKVPGQASGAGFVVPFPNGRAFANGIGIRVTGLVADNDNTALAANVINCDVGFK